MELSQCWGQKWHQGDLVMSIQRKLICREETRNRDRKKRDQETDIPGSLLGAF